MGLGIAEFAVLGICCVVPVFVVGIVAFFFMFRGQGGGNSGQGFNSPDTRGRSGGGNYGGGGGNYGGACGGGGGGNYGGGAATGGAAGTYGKKPREEDPGEFQDKKIIDDEDDGYGKAPPHKQKAYDDSPAGKEKAGGYDDPSAGKGDSTGYADPSPGKEKEAYEEPPPANEEGEEQK